MDRNIRRALYTALVAAGLVVAAASAAHAADASPDPAAPGTTGTIGEPGAARGDLSEAVDDAAVAPGAGGLVGDIVGPEGILGSLVAGAVAGALGEDGVVDDLLGLPSTGAPGTDGPGTPGTEEPGTDGPGTGAPGTGGPGTDEPGTGGPGTDEPGTDPGTGLPGIGLPGTDEPGTDEPGTDEPGTDEPGTDEPGTDEPGTDEPGTDRPGANKPGANKPGTKPAAEPSRPEADHSSTDRPGTGPATVGQYAGHRGGSWAGTPEAVSLTSGRVARDTGNLGTQDTDDLNDSADVDTDTARELPDGGVDISWGDKADAAPVQEYDGSILMGDLTDGLMGTDVEPEPAPESAAATPVALPPGDVYARTGHMFTGQLSLISLLLGLGIAALRTRRR